MASKAALALAVLALLVFGCINTLTTKIQYTLISVGSDGEEKTFTKPWFGNFAMFVAMSGALLVQGVVEICQRRQQSPDPCPGGQPLLQAGKAQDSSQSKSVLWIAIPASFDLVASGIARTGLLYMSSSMWQMLRGSMIVFSALISVPLLGRKLYCYHWVGVLTCVGGITCVGYANVLDQANTAASSAGSNAWFGIILVLGAQVIQATQIVVEEKLLKDLSFPPMKVVGFEGLWGMTLCVLVLFPVCWMLPGDDNGHLEDEVDTITLIRNNTTLQQVIVLYTFSVCVFNCAGMYVTSSLSAVHRTMLEAARTASIWMFDLGVHYFVSKDIAFGEAWTENSKIQLGGFALVASGQIIYGGLVKLPGFYYPPPPKPVNWESPLSLRESMSPMPRETVDEINVDEFTEAA